MKIHLTIIKIAYHLVSDIGAFHQWGHTAIGQDKCCLFGNHPTMTQRPYVVGGSLSTIIITTLIVFQQVVSTLVL